VLQPTNGGFFLREKPPAAKAEAGRKSLAARRAGSIPASGTMNQIWFVKKSSVRNYCMF
jgi:hypothetical protein